MEYNNLKPIQIS